MTNTKKIVWRLKERPTTAELRELVGDGIIDKGEARQILFSEETEEDRDKKSLQEEIIFLRRMVEKLSNGNNSTIITTIQECHRKHYDTYPWYGQYQGWCSNLQNYQSNLTSIGSGSNDIMNAMQSNANYSATAENNGLQLATLNAGIGSTAMQSASFKDIKTF